MEEDQQLSRSFEPFAHHELFCERKVKLRAINTLWGLKMTLQGLFVHMSLGTRFCLGVVSVVVSHTPV